jgi:hypothetical protein
MLGKFLEFSVHAPNIIESLGFYRSIGFTELETGDVWPHGYAVVSDGDICIGLHDRVFDSPALTFVQQDLARHARSMTDHGFDFSFLRIDENVFNELGFADRDGNMISLVEARTFSPAADDLNDSMCGSCFELTLPVRDTMHAGLFWAPLAPTLLTLREEPTTHMRFDASGIALGLSESIALDGPSLCFRCDDKDAIWTAIAQHGFKFKEFPGFEGSFMALQAPEGTMLYLFKEDFLGELYEVAETDELEQESEEESGEEE